MCGSYLLNDFREFEILLEIFTLKTWIFPAPVRLGEIVHALDFSGQESASDRAVGDQSNSQLTERGQYFFLHTARPQRIFGLNGAHRMDLVSPPDDSGTDFGQTDISHLALLHQIGHCAGGVLNRRVRIETVLVIKINVTGS